MLNAFDGLSGIALVPMPVERFGHHTELDDEVAGEVLRLDFAPFLPPEAGEGGLIVAHDDAGIGAADEAASIGRIEYPYKRLFHLNPWVANWIQL